jgi:1-acyl-sn-glycerol-3-phosphate acyltransferase
MRLIRSTLFNGVFILLTGVISLLLIISRPFGFAASWFWGRAWSRLVLGSLRLICGVRVVIDGREHLPDVPCVVMAKHQSAFETVAMPLLIPPFVWVLKRELFYIPIFGWALRALNAIAIRRSQPREALKQVLAQGKDFLEQGRWVVIFPEGTRSAPGESGQYQASGIMLAQQAAAGILPMAHNAGQHWPKHGFVKHPGTIRIRFLPYIPAEQIKAAKRNDLLVRLETEIEAATRELEAAG